MYRYLKRVSGVGTVSIFYFWKSNGFSDENITAPNTNFYCLNSQLYYLRIKTRVEFKGSCLKQDKITYDHGKVVNIYIAYEVNKNFNISSYSTLKNCLCGAVSLQKMLILISTNILDMVLDLTDMDFFHTLAVELVEM